VGAVSSHELPLDEDTAILTFIAFTASFAYPLVFLFDHTAANAAERGTPLYPPSGRNPDTAKPPRRRPDTAGAVTPAMRCDPPETPGRTPRRVGIAVAATDPRNERVGPDHASCATRGAHEVFVL
jgi:hypothetical protein